MRILITLLLFASASHLHSASHAGAVIADQARGYTLIADYTAKAEIRIAVPDAWNRGVLIFNHGYVWEDRPVAVDLPLTREPFASFIEQGWMVAASSYRRNGVIIGDAVQDARELIDAILDTFSEPARILVIGESMGGAVALRMAEARYTPIDGALIVGSGLLMDDPGSPYEPTWRPSVPVLLLSNTSEIAQAESYYEEVWRHDGPVALWRVERPGHLNFNTPEWLDALQGLNRWIDGEVVALKKDATVDSEPPVSRATFADGSATGSIVAIDEAFGNLHTDLVTADYDRLGIAPGDAFRIELNGRSFAARRVTTYADVPVGDWLGFPTAEGRFLLAINRQSAAEASGARAGMAVSVSAE